ncbi:MAG: type II 3-dehydroquinate dehydratase [Pseudomonadota bacterium]
MKALIVNGPNLNLLGEREPEVYGSESLQDINAWITDSMPSIQLTFFQSNHEGELIDFLQQHRQQDYALVINPGGLTHYSVALRDAIAGCQYRAVEVHLSDIHAREDFRQISMIKDVCIAQVAGKGKQGYLDALSILGDDATTKSI